MKRCRQGGDANDGVRSALAGRPVELPNVEATREADPTSNAVCALRDRVPVERERVFLFDEDVERPIVCVPRVLQLHFPVKSQRGKERKKQMYINRKQTNNFLPAVTTQKC